jgi:hypothetical protein
VQEALQARCQEQRARLDALTADLQVWFGTGHERLLSVIPGIDISGLLPNPDIPGAASKLPALQA